MTQLATAILAALLAGACASIPDPTDPTQAPPTTDLVRLDAHESQLAESFERSSGQAQLVVVLSPT